MNLRMTERHYQEMRQITAASFLPSLELPFETGCILLLARNDHPSHPSLLVTEIMAPEADDLAECAEDGLVFASRFLRRALLRVRSLNLAGFLTVHTHPHSNQHVGFSPYDDDNDPALMQNLFELKPDGMFGSVVLGKQAIAARIWQPLTEKAQELPELVIVGERLSHLPLTGKPAPPAATASAIFDRSLALTSDSALARLAQMRIGVVGASGTGSLMAELLARAGAGEIVLFDFDAIEETNLNRVLHARRQDAAACANKAQRLAQALNELGLPTKIVATPLGDIRQQTAALDLRGCDVLFGCVDRDWPRLLLCELAHQYLIPYIDLGTEIGIGNSELQSLDSRVSYIAPGRACLICSGIISLERVRLESLDEAERDRIIAMGYSEDIRINTPAVMELNMRAASYGGLLLRHLLQPFLDTPLSTHFKESLTNYSTRGVLHQQRAGCVICGDSTRTGRGDSQQLTGLR